MKRRNFLAGLTGFVATVKLATTGEAAPVPVPAVDATIARIPEQLATRNLKRDHSVVGECRRFAEKYQLDLDIWNGRACFTLRHPAGERRFTAGLLHWNRAANKRLPLPHIDRQLKYQLAKSIQEIEREYGIRGTPPGVSIRRQSGAVGGYGDDGFFPSPSGPVYTESESWVWENVVERLSREVRFHE